MSPDQIRSARHQLGLSQAELGRLLDTDGQTVRRMESPPETSKHRRPAPRMVRLLEAYLAGYRPADWPTRKDTDDDPIPDVPLCVFCGAPWDEPMLRDLSISQGCPTCGYGKEVSVTITIQCSACYSVVYQKEVEG